MHPDKRARRKIFVVAVVAFSSLLLFTLASHARSLVEVVSSTSTERDSTPSFKRVSFVTYTDRATDGLCLSALTAALQGIELMIVGVAGDNADGELDFSNVTNAKTRKLPPCVVSSSQLNTLIPQFFSKVTTNRKVK